MSALLLAALERLSPRARRSVVAVGAPLALGAAMAALTLIGPHRGDKREPTLPRPARTSLPHTRRAGSRRPSSLASSLSRGEWGSGSSSAICRSRTVAETLSRSAASRPRYAASCSGNGPG